jgi:hypothetical protein
MTYKIVFDDGIPNESECETVQDLEEELRRLYIISKTSDYFDIRIYELKDITKTQFIEEMIYKIVGNKQC